MISLRKITDQWVCTIIFSILIASVVGGVWASLFFRTRTGNDSPPQVENVSVLAPAPARVTPSTSTAQTTLPQVQEASENPLEQVLEYHNAARAFSLRYPKELSVKEYNEGGDAYTIVFEDADSREGEKSFQVFFTPYFGETIAQSRIVQDVPSGKFTKPVEIVIGDSTRALAFFSESEFGEMREVWFLYNDFLYEVTTYKELDSWLAGIMSTWQWL